MVEGLDHTEYADARNRVELRLTGGEHSGGEIPLDELAIIASRTQALVTRLARSLTDRASAGRTPGLIEERNRLMLVGLRAGSPTTVLEIAGPPLQLELELRDVPSDVGSQSMSLLADALDAAAHPAVPLPVLSDVSLRSLDDWLAALAPYEWFEVTTSVRGTVRRQSGSPALAREELAHKRQETAPEGLIDPPERAVEGRLYAVNLHTGRFAIEDDFGHSITLKLQGLTTDEVADLLVRGRVHVAGTPHFDVHGRLTALEATQIGPAPEIEGLDPEAFWRNLELNELMRGAEPLPPVEDFEIADLTEDEVQGFWTAIEE